MNKSALMHTAWVFVKEFGFTMSEALKQAWMQFKLRARMLKGIVKFYFMKADGSVRKAYGTLLNVPATKGMRGPQKGCQTYYDVEKNEWRCYRIERLLSVA